MPTHRTDLIDPRRSHLRVSVDGTRWHAGQIWELAIWRKRNRVLNRMAIRLKSILEMIIGRNFVTVNDDWNYWWAEQFGNYKVLPNKIGRAIEIGCGPYTNLRLILSSVKVGEIVCSDPLSLHYIQFKNSWLAQAYRQGIVQIDNHAVENLDLFLPNPFDLVIMINVLDHVRDAVLAMANAQGITNSRGFFILGQDLTNADDIQEIGEDIGHPIRIDREWLDERVLSAFEPLFYRILPRESGRNPTAHYGTYIFIGRKRNHQRECDF